MNTETNNVHTNINAVNSNGLASLNHGTHRKTFLEKLIDSLTAADPKYTLEVLKSTLDCFDPSDEELELASNHLSEPTSSLRMAKKSGNLKMCRIKGVKSIAIHDERKGVWVSSRLPVVKCKEVAEPKAETTAAKLVKTSPVVSSPVPGEVQDSEDEVEEKVMNQTEQSASESEEPEQGIHLNMDHEPDKKSPEKNQVCPSESPIKSIHEFRDSHQMEPVDSMAESEEIVDDENHFKLSCFPAPIQALIMAIHKFAGAPIPFIALSILGAFSSAIGKGLRISNPVNGRRTWLNVQILMALPSGEGKSETGKIVFKPLYDLFGGVVERFLKEVAPSVEADLAKVSQDIKRLEKKGITDSNKSELAELLRRQLELEEMLLQPKFIAKDATDAMVDKMLVENSGFISFVDYEARSALNNILGSTTGSRSQHTSETKFLPGYSGEQITSDRLSRQAHIQAAVISSCFAAQPDKVEAILKHPEMKESGFIARQLLYFSRKRNIQVRSTAIPDDILNSYHLLIQNIASTYRVGSNCKTKAQHDELLLTNDQGELLIQYHSDIRDKICDGQITYHADSAARLAEQATKIVGCLHVMHQGSRSHEVAISDQCIQDAIEMTQYFFDRFQDVTKEQVKDHDQEKINKIIKLAKSTESQGVKPRDIVAAHICSTATEVRTLLDTCPDFMKVIGKRKDSVIYVIKD